MRADRVSHADPAVAVAPGHDVAPHPLFLDEPSACQRLASLNAKPAVWKGIQATGSGVRLGLSVCCDQLHPQACDSAGRELPQSELGCQAPNGPKSRARQTLNPRLADPESWPGSSEEGTGTDARNECSSKASMRFGVATLDSGARLGESPVLEEARLGGERDLGTVQTPD